MPPRRRRRMHAGHPPPPRSLRGGGGKRGRVNGEGREGRGGQLREEEHASVLVNRSRSGTKNANSASLDGWKSCAEAVQVKQDPKSAESLLLLRSGRCSERSIAFTCGPKSRNKRLISRNKNAGGLSNFRSKRPRADVPPGVSWEMWWRNTCVPVCTCEVPRELGPKPAGVPGLFPPPFPPV